MTPYYERDWITNHAGVASGYGVMRHDDDAAGCNSPLPPPFYDRDGITIYLGECQPILAAMDTKSVDLVITDPPFNARFTYGDDFDDNRPWEEYAADIAATIGMCERVSRGMVMVFVSVTGMVQLCGVRPPRWVCSWTKPMGSTHIAGNSGFFPRWEPCLIYGQTWGAGGRVPEGTMPDAWNVAPVRPNGHPCPKPTALIATILNRHPAGVILDPYMGSGTTLVAAKALGRRAIGIERNEAYCRIAVQRLQQSVLPLQEAVGS